MSEYSILEDLYGLTMAEEDALQAEVDALSDAEANRQAKRFAKLGNNDPVADDDGVLPCPKCKQLPTQWAYQGCSKDLHSIMCCGVNLQGRGSGGWEPREAVYAFRDARTRWNKYAAGKPNPPPPPPPPDTRTKKQRDADFKAFMDIIKRIDPPDTLPIAKLLNQPRRR
jgi:hypothetical protein